MISLPDRPQPVLNDIVIRRGGYFTDRRDNEVIIDESFAERHHLEPGQWVRLVLNNRQQELFVVGTAVSSEFVYLLGPGAIIPDPEQFGVFYLKQTYAEDVFDFQGAVNEVVGRFTPDVRNPQEVLDRAERLLEPYGVFATIPLKEQPSHAYLDQEIRSLRAFGFFMPTIFLTVAAMVLNVLLTRLVEQQRVTVGTLKALGYSNAQIFQHFLKFGLTVGLAGGLAGCVQGYLLAGLATWNYRRFYELPDLVNRVYPWLDVRAVTVSLACALTGTLYGAQAVLRLRPAEAMRPRTAKRGKAVFLERARWLWRRLSSGWRLVLRDVVRNRVRSLAGAFAAAMGACLLVAGFMMANATDYLIDFQFKWLLKNDLELVFKDERGIDAIDEIARLPGIDRAEPVLNVPCDFIHGPYRKKGAVTGLAADARLTIPRDQLARPIRIPASGLAMTRKLAEILHLQAGDWVVVRPVKGNRREFHVPVAEISDSYLGIAVYTDFRFLSRQINEEAIVTGAQATTNQSRRDLAALYGQLKEMPGLQSVTSVRAMARSLQETFVWMIRVFILVLVTFAGAVFFGSILNASLVSLAERQREVATLRVLGYGPWEVGSLLLRESLIVTLAGALAGMPLGYLLMCWLSEMYDTEIFRYPVVTSPGTWGWTLVLAFVFALTAHLFVQRTIHRMNWLEALQAKE